MERLHLEWRAGAVLVLGLVVVAADRRGQGVLHGVLARVVAAADERDAALAATPTGDFGADPSRLRAYLYGWGFVRNAGALRDWRVKDDLIRPARAEAGRTEVHPLPSTPDEGQSAS